MKATGRSARIGVVQQPAAIEGAGVARVGGREDLHLRYVMDHGCAQFVGAMRVFMLDCAYSATPTAMCDRSVDTWLVHGDRKRCR